MSTTTEIQRINVNEIAETMQGAGAILTANEVFGNKAVTGAQRLLDTIEAEGMTDELDAAVNEWQVKAKQAIVIMNNRRSPITQIMTKMAKYFTEIEGKIDPAKPDSVYARLQLKRNAYAKQKADEQKAKEAEILKKQNIAKDKITFKAEVETHIRSIYGQKLLTFKQHAVKIYDSLTIETEFVVIEGLKAIKINYPVEAFNKIEPVSAKAFYLSSNDQKQIINDVRDSLYNELSANFRENMEAERDRLLDIVPSRINELKAIAKAGAEQKAAMEKAAEDRRIADQLKQQHEAAVQAEKDKATIAATTQMETATSLFDTAAQLAEVKEESAAKVRQGYKINVLNVAGVGAMYMFWFEKQGLKLTVEEALKKTGNQQKAFCEKHAHTTGEMIDSIHLEYEEDYKAIASSK
jgi:hypothetical protein